MAESSWLWDGETPGDAHKLSSADLDDLLELILLADAGVALGVAQGYLNSLVPTAAAPNVAVASGGALVKGMPYKSTGSVNVNIPTPAGATRIDRIVLRRVWADKEIRLTRIAGAEGGAAPAITQTDGVTWDLPICKASITTAGVITVTDERRYFNEKFRKGDILMMWPDSIDVNKNPVVGGVARTDWFFCNGDTRRGVVTPNLMGSVPIGATGIVAGAYPLGGTGGSATKDVSHTHGPGTLATDTEAAHNHGVSITSGNPSAWEGVADGGGPPAAPRWDHKHSVSGNTANGGAHDHAVSAGATASGGSATQDILPPYVALPFFMYIPL